MKSSLFTNFIRCFAQCNIVNIVTSVSHANPGDSQINIVKGALSLSQNVKGNALQIHLECAIVEDESKNCKNEAVQTEPYHLNFYTNVYLEMKNTYCLFR